MLNLANHIEQNCPECSTNEQLDFLHKKGFISYIPEYYLEVYNFYVELEKSYRPDRKAKMKARLDTQEHFGINKQKFYRIKRAIV